MELFLCLEYLMIQQDMLTKVAENGMCNSVMEYPSINFARNKAEQTRFYDDSPGPYDKWVIEYGYSIRREEEDADAEAARLSAILERSTDPLLQFGNDADDMRSTGRGINPDVNLSLIHI